MLSQPTDFERTDAMHAIILLTAKGTLMMPIFAQYPHEGLCTQAWQAHMHMASPSTAKRLTRKIETYVFQSRFMTGIFPVSWSFRISNTHANATSEETAELLCSFGPLRVGSVCTACVA